MLLFIVHFVFSYKESTMETILCVLRPKQTVTPVTRDFSPSAFDVLLTDVKIPGSPEKAKPVKQLPRTDISYEQEPTDALFEYLYDLTGAHYGGIKGKVFFCLCFVFAF